MAQPSRRNGPWVVLIVLGLSVLGALGTCSRFREENPLSANPELISSREVRGDFSGDNARKIQPGMMAVVSFENSRERFEGRVLAVEKIDAVRRVTAVFPEDLPAAKTDKLSVDVSGFPD